MMHVIRCKLLLGASLLVTCAATPAIAQEGGVQAASVSDGVVADNIIIVQARRRDETVQDVPAVVQAVTSDQINNLEFRRFEDVSSLVPGLSLEASLGGISGTATLRGVDFDARAAGSNTTVEFYRNDAVIPNSGLFQALYDVEQIEVLRGPQGTLKGRASPSGSITVHTRKPDLFEAGGFGSATYAERDKYNVNGAINVPIIRDRLGIRIAGFTGENRGNLVRGLNLLTGAVDDDIYDRTDAIRVSARAVPFDNDILILDFNYEGIGRKQRFYRQVESFSEVSSSAPASPVTISSKDFLGVDPLASTSQANLHIYNWQAQLNLFGQSLIYVGQDFSAKTDFLDSQDFAGVITNSPFNGVPYANSTATVSKNKVHEVRLQNEERVFGMFDYVVGYLNLKQNSPTSTTTLVGFAGPSPAPPAGFGDPFIDLAFLLRLPIDRYRESTEESFFGNLTAHIGESTEISGGARHITVRQNSGLLVNGSPLDAATDCRGFSDIANCGPKSTKTIFSASAQHKFTDDIMAYASFGTSYRPGNVVVATVFSGISPFLNQFIRPTDETSKSYEIGLKTSWLNNTLRFNVTGFYQEFSNFALRPGSPVVMLADVYDAADTKALTSFNGLVVTADAKIKGMEAELNWVPSNNFNLSGVLSYTDGKIKDARFPCVDLNDDNVPDLTPPTAEQLFAEVGGNQVDVCLSDTTPGSSPKWAASMIAEYSQALSLNAEGFVRGLMTFKGHSDGIGVNPLDQVNSYALFDLFLGIRDPEGSWSVTAYGKNILDTHRVLSRTDAPYATATRSGAFSGTNYVGVTSTQPREFGVTARIALGSR